MELPSNYSEKFRPRPRKIGQPRNEREQLIEQFRSRLNEEQRRDGRQSYSFAHLAKRFQDVSDSGLYQLFQECSEPSVKSFGAIMTWKLKQL